MFPSPQGGSETRNWTQMAGQVNRVSIPSRRVGDFNSASACRRFIVFPSPQGGSETDAFSLKDKRYALVSIPSRRVGDRHPPLRSGLLGGFPSPQGGSETSLTCRINSASFVSIPSRRVGDNMLPENCTVANICFHPLKAGRRHNIALLPS